jgi:crotonobetainyl-CoA:carnitine CoA-transferase CaiB-like acyl-CoA transferase
VSENALDGVLVVEAGDGLATAYCGKLLADLGARVILLERPDGARLRRLGPTKNGAAHGGLFAHFGANKESAVLRGSSTLQALLDRADILLTDPESPVTGELAAIDPDTLIHIDISDFGRSGPYAGWKATDFTVWAMGGYMYLTGEKSREPLVVPGGQASLHGGMHAAIAGLAALCEKRSSGLGQFVEVSNLEAVLSAHAWLTVAWSHHGTLLSRGTHDFIPCKDGWLNFMQLIHYPNIFLLIDRPDLMDDPRWADITGWMANGPDLWGMVTEWCSTRTRQEIFEAAQQLRLAVCPVNTAKDLVESEQMAARSWWLEVDDQALGKVKLPGFPYRLSASPPAIHSSAPAVGQHTEAITREFSGRPLPSPRLPSVPQAAGPLTGLRVVEITSNWAGPVCGRHLADLGADVIKVESPTRTAARATQYPANDPQRQGYNRSGYFNQLNRNKRDLVVDLAAPAGKQAFLELMKVTDVLIENNSARVMPNLGLDYATLSGVNPRLIMVSMTAFGADGPQRDYVAFGSNIEASCGLAATVGYDPSQVYRTNFYYADPVSGGHGTVAILAALEYRRRTGKGQFVDMSLNECGAGFFAESLIQYTLTGELYQPQGNRDASACPQGVYRSAGSDNWLAVSVTTDEQWGALCRVIDKPELANHAAYGTSEARRERADEIDGLISAWAAGLEQYEAAWMLQREGVPAAPVLANWQLLADLHLYRRSFYREIEHPVIGVYRFPSWPWELSRTPASVRNAAPLYAEHNRVILGEAGLSEGQIDELYATGVTSDAPR